MVRSRWKNGGSPIRSCWTRQPPSPSGCWKTPICRRASAGTVEDLIVVARTLDVSPDALSHHLHDRGFIAFEEREVLRAQLIRTKVPAAHQD